MTHVYTMGFSAHDPWCVDIFLNRILRNRIFVYQVADRTLVYFDYNTTVSVKVRYTDRVPFPAVTVCDINTFRFVLFQFLYKNERISAYLRELGKQQHKKDISVKTPLGYLKLQLSQNVEERNS